MDDFKDANSECTDSFDKSMELVNLFQKLSLEDLSRQSAAIVNKVVIETINITNSQDDDTSSEASLNIGSNTAHRFRALGKVIHFMRKRYQNGNDTASMTLDEILEQTNQNYLNDEVKQWLAMEALPNSKRIRVSDDGEYFQFKPPFKLQSAHDLVELLKDYERKGLGGILMDDIRDSLPNYRQILKQCDSSVLVLKRPFDMKRIVYYVDQDAAPVTDYEIQSMWRSLGLEAIEEVYEPLDGDEFDC